MTAWFDVFLFCRRHLSSVIGIGTCVYRSNCLIKCNKLPGCDIDDMQKMPPSVFVGSIVSVVDLAKVFSTIFFVQMFSFSFQILFNGRNGETHDLQCVTLQSKLKRSTYTRCLITSSFIWSNAHIHVRAHAQITANVGCNYQFRSI